MKGKTIDVSGWEELISKRDPDIPEGYSTAEEIATKKGLGLAYTSVLLKRLRDSGKIGCIRAKSSRGKTIWVYKD